MGINLKDQNRAKAVPLDSLIRGNRRSKKITVEGTNKVTVNGDHHEVHGDLLGREGTVGTNKSLREETLMDIELISISSVVVKKIFDLGNVGVSREGVSSINIQNLTHDSVGVIKMLESFYFTVTTNEISVNLNHDIPRYSKYFKKIMGDADFLVQKWKKHSKMSQSRDQEVIQSPGKKTIQNTFKRRLVFTFRAIKLNIEDLP